MCNKEYNGWTNYPTWRVNLEMFDGYSTDVMVDADYVEEMAETDLEFNCDNQQTLSYALSFLADVNWHEIAEAINERCNLKE